MAILKHHTRHDVATGHQSSAVITNSILKVKTLDESIRSTERYSTARKVRQSMRRIFSVAQDLKNDESSFPEGSPKPKGRPTKRTYRPSFEQSTQSLRTSFRQSRRYMRNSSAFQSIKNMFSSQSSEIGMKSLDKNLSKSVKFDALFVREYKTQADVNPGVSKGAALSLSWDYITCPSVLVDKYEDSRPPRKKLNELKLSSAERQERLQSCGVSRAEMDKAIKQTNIAKRKRRETIEQLSQSATQEKLEKFKRGFKKKIGLRKSDKQEQEDLWRNAEAYFLKNC